MENGVNDRAERKRIMEERINELFLSMVQEKYQMHSVDIIENFLCKKLTYKEKTPDIYVLLSKDWSIHTEFEDLFEKLGVFEGGIRDERYYLVVMPQEKTTKDMFSAMNGLSFVEFMFYDVTRNELLGTKIKSFTQTREITELKNLYQKSFDDLCDIKGH